MAEKWRAEKWGGEKSPRSYSAALALRFLLWLLLRCESEGAVECSIPDIRLVVFHTVLL